MPSDSLESLPTTSLPVEAAVELAHALLQRECDRRRLHVIFLKGPGAQAQGLRPPTVSSDVDLLMAPDDGVKLQKALIASGWTQRPKGQVGVALDHATTLWHPRWPIDIDIHRHIPGLGVPPEDAFLSLTRRSVRLRLAHWDVSFPHRVDHALLLALNAARSRWDHRAQRSLGFLADSLSDAEMAELGTRIIELRSGPEMAPFAAVHSRGLIRASRSAPSREWLLYQRQDHPAVLWLDALHRAPLHQKLVIALRALVPSHHSMAADDLRLAHASAGTLARGRCDRFVRFLKASPSALTSYLEFRRSLRDMHTNHREHRP